MPWFWDWKEKEQGPEEGKKEERKDRYSNKLSSVKFEVFTEIK